MEFVCIFQCIYISMSKPIPKPKPGFQGVKLRKPKPYPTFHNSQHQYSVSNIQIFSQFIYQNLMNNCIIRYVSQYFFPIFDTFQLYKFEWKSSSTVEYCLVRPKMLSTFYFAQFSKQTKIQYVGSFFEAARCLVYFRLVIG